MGLCSGGAAARSFRKERILESHSFLSSLRSRFKKVHFLFALVFPTKLITFFHLEGSVPHSDFNDGNNLRTPALQ